MNDQLNFKGSIMFLFHISSSNISVEKKEIWSINITSVVTKTGPIDQ